MQRFGWTARAVVGIAVALGSGGLVGCGGEKELPVLSSDKDKDELQKDMENPYGTPAKTKPAGQAK